MSLEATRIRARKRESVRTEWIPVDLAEVIADLAGASVRILELQNRLLDLSGHLAYLDGAAVVGGEIGLLVGAGVGFEFVDGAAGGDTSVVFALAADVDVDGERAGIAHVCLTFSTGGGIDVGDRGSAGDDGGISHGRGGSIVSWRWDRQGGGSKVPHGYKSHGDDRCEMHCCYGGLVLVAMEEDNVELVKKRL